MTGWPALWRRAPIALLFYRPVLVGVVCAAVCASFAAATGPLVSSAVGSSTLNSELKSLGPVAAGVQITDTDAPRSADAASARRRDAAIRTLFENGPPPSRSIRTTYGEPVEIRSPFVGDGSPIFVIPMHRTGALEHVRRLTHGTADGVWIADSVAVPAHLHAGDPIKVGVPLARSLRIVTLRVAGIYHALNASVPDYWANFTQMLRPLNPDSSNQPPTFMFGDAATVLRLERGSVTPKLTDIWEFPIEPAGMTRSRAMEVERQAAAIETRLRTPSDPVTQALGGCGLGRRHPTCTARSSLSAVLTLARKSSSAITSTIALLVGVGIAISLAASAAAGWFLTKRREPEARLMVSRGEHPARFAARIALEATLPTAAGWAAGAALAAALTRAFAPHGTLDPGVGRAAVGHAGLASLAGLVVLAAAAGNGMPGRESTRVWRRRIGTIPWEIPLLLAAVALAYDALDRHGGASTQAAGHPRLTVLAFPLVATAGFTGLAVRAMRRMLPRPDRVGPAFYLATRRLAQARGALTLVVSATGVGICALLFAQTLALSLSRSANEKAYIANGSDVSGVISYEVPLPTNLPYPLAKVETDYQDAVLEGSGATTIELIAVDPAAVARVMHWSSSWGRDPRPALRSLDAPDGDALPALTVGFHAPPTGFSEYGMRIPIAVVADEPVFPGMAADMPALVVSRRALLRIAAQRHITEPLAGATTSVWASGPARAVERALLSDNLLGVSYLASAADVKQRPDVRAATRTYSFIRATAIAASILAIVAILLYLQVRHRSRIVSTALGRRLGMRRRDDVLALVVEIATIVVVAALVATTVALVCARLAIGHVDPLPALPPKPVFVGPWSVLPIVLAATIVSIVAIATAVVVAGERGDVAEALRDA